MAVEVHVEGRIALGRLADFFEAVKGYVAHARAHGYAEPRVLQGLSGAMNTIRLVYTYPDLNAYEWIARVNVLLALLVIALAVALVRGLPW